MSNEVTESVSAYSTGFLGSLAGISFDEGSILLWLSILVVTGRFVYDTVRFWHYLKDRKDE